MFLLLFVFYVPFTFPVNVSFECFLLVFPFNVHVKVPFNIRSNVRSNIHYNVHSPAAVHIPFHDPF